MLSIRAIDVPLYLARRKADIRVLVLDHGNDGSYLHGSSKSKQRRSQGMVVRSTPPLQYDALYRRSDLRHYLDSDLVAFRRAFPLSGNHRACHHFLGHTLSCWCWPCKRLLLSWTTERAAYSPAQRAHLSPSGLWSWRRFLTAPDLLSTYFEFASCVSKPPGVHRRVWGTACSWCGTASAQGCAAGWHRQSERRIQLDQDLIGLRLISSVILLPHGADYSLARFSLR